MTAWDNIHGLTPEEGDLLDREREKAFQAAHQFSGRFETLFYTLAQKCESPIERILATHLCAIGSDYGAVVIPIVSQESARAFEALRFCDNVIGVVPQYLIKPWRADFLVTWPDINEPPLLNNAVIVECDGHEFHERTKDQAARDRSRDRHLLSRGLRTLRFTGSEIYRDAAKCVRDIENTLTGHPIRAGANAK